MEDTDTVNGYYAKAAEALSQLREAVENERRIRRLSYREAAEEAEVPSSTLYRLHQTGNCSVENAIKILQWLDRHGPSNGE